MERARKNIMSNQSGFCLTGPAVDLINVGSGFDWSIVRKLTVRVTPQLAREWLSRNTNNRGLKKGRVSDLAANIVAGKWIYDGSPIKFDRAGVLSDGQHRLAAIALANVSCVLDVVFGLDPQARLVHDTGVPRSTADIVKLVSSIPSHTTQTAWFATTHRIYHGIHKRFDPSLVVARYESMQPQIDWLLSLYKGTKFGVRAAPIWAAFALAITLDDVITRRFVERYARGDELQRGDPALVLREVAMSSRGTGHVAGERMFRLAVNALAANLAGRKVAQLKLSDAAMEWIHPAVVRGFGAPPL